MKKNLKLLKFLAPFALVAITFSTPQTIHGMERFSKNEEQKDPPGMSEKEEIEDLKKQLAEYKKLAQEATAALGVQARAQAGPPPAYMESEQRQVSIVEALRRVAEAEKLHSKEYQEAKKQEMLMATREMRLGFGINVYEILSDPNLYYRHVALCMKDARKFINSISNTTDQLPQLDSNSTALDLYFDAFTTVISDDARYTPKSRLIRRHESQISNLIDLIKKDLSETIELYQELHGVPHPRSDEVSCI